MTTKDKINRARRRSAEFENKRAYLRKDMHLFTDELALFPDAAHDDIFDAYGFARQVSQLQQVPHILQVGFGYGIGEGLRVTNRPDWKPGASIYVHESFNV